MTMELHLLAGGAQGKYRFFRKEMKGLIALVILCSLFVILYTNTKAQWYKPYGSYQWEGAEVQRLTYNTSGKRMVGLCIEKKLAPGFDGAVSACEKKQCRRFRRTRRME